MKQTSIHPLLYICYISCMTAAGPQTYLSFYLANYLLSTLWWMTKDVRQHNTYIKELDIFFLHNDIFDIFLFDAKNECRRKKTKKQWLCCGGHCAHIIWVHLSPWWWCLPSRGTRAHWRVWWKLFTVAFTVTKSKPNLNMYARFGDDISYVSICVCTKTKGMLFRRMLFIFLLKIQRLVESMLKPTETVLLLCFSISHRLYG